MVLLHMKRSDNEQFLFETTVEATVRDTIKELAQVHNLQHKIKRLKLEGGELAKYGPAKHPDKQGIDTYSEEAIEKTQYYNMDPTGRRTGNACSQDVAKVLLKTLDDAEAVCSKNQVEKKVPLSAKLLQEAIDNIRGAVMICYPMGLPEWDLIRIELENREDLSGTSYANDELDPETSTLWFAGKQLLPEKQLKDYVGRQEKTKAVIKLQRKGQGPPAREPVVDAETQKAMLSWYHKKQEEEKKLADDDDDSHANSAWANPQSLKSHFAGVTTVRMPR